MNPIKSLRARYIIALGTLAIAIYASNSYMQNMIVRQENYGRVIRMAGDQIGLLNRISFAAGRMHHSSSQSEYTAAQKDVSSAVNLMQTQHDILLNGAPDQGLPRIMTPLLKQYYFNKDFAYDTYIRQFLKHAQTIGNTAFKGFSEETAAYNYVVAHRSNTFATLMDNIEQEYAQFARTDIKRLQNHETLVTGATLFLLLIEALFIFYPMDLEIQRAFQVIREKNRHLATEKKRAEHASQCKSSFLSTVSHELRTPLNAIIGFSECLQAGVYGAIASPQQSESIDNIHKSGTHLLDLVEDILDVSLTDTGKIILHEKETPLNDMIRQSIAMVTPLAENAEISLTMNALDPSLSLYVDERRVQQILFNLLTNAIKFTPQGGRVQVGSCYQPGGYAAIYVLDTGYGMSAKEIQIARERFGRVEDVLTRQHDGAGLGIPLVIELMACHDGDVLIESTKGHGTTVTVTFPSHRIIDTQNKKPTIQATFQTKRLAVTPGHVPTAASIEGQQALNSP